MKKIIVANWKMNPQTYKEAEGLLKNISKKIKKVDNTEIVICPPFAWLTDFSHKNKSKVAFGAQNMFYEEKGAYTGEVSPQMLKSSKVDYVILGHSERRKYFNETDQVINKKVKKALDIGLNVILCVGETKEQRQAGQTYQVLEKQLAQGLHDISSSLLEQSELSIAYEPIWAIGTGENCSVKQTKEVIVFIKKLVSESTRVLYGGSVDSTNSALYINDAGSDGLLVGGASLDAEEFVKIISSI